MPALNWIGKETVVVVLTGPVSDFLPPFVVPNMIHAVADGAGGLVAGDRTRFKQPPRARVV